MIVYGDGGDSDGDIGMRGSGMGCDGWAKRTNPVLDLVSNLYSKLKILVGDSGHSSCSTYTIYWLLFLPTTTLENF